MSKKMKNSILFCMTATLITAGSLSLLATENKQVETTVNVQAEESAEMADDEVNSASEGTETTSSSSYTPPTKKNETVYINLDAYGQKEIINVVNGYHLNGSATQIVDYGNYSDIVNLTNFSKPTIDGDKLTWDLEEGATEFYYQGTLEDITLPWDIQIRYKLNGVEVSANQLPGAKGMIETIIDVIPNEDAADYYKNNFLLQMTTSYDMGKCLSVEAPDATVVTLGQTKSITYMALPGQSTTFHLYVGSDSYESSGLSLVMAPLQMSSLSDIKELKEKKEDIEDATDAASDSIDIILDSASNMKGGLTALSDGMRALQDSIHNVRAEDAANDAEIENLLNAVDQLTTTLNTLTPHIDTSQSMVSDIYSAMNALNNDVQNMKPYLESTKTLAGDAKTAAEGIKESTTNLKSMITDLSSAQSDLNDKLNGLYDQLGTFEDYLDDLSKALYNTSDAIDDVGSQSSALSYLVDAAYKDEPLKGQLVGSVLHATSPVLNQTSTLLNKTAHVVNRTEELTIQMNKIITVTKKLNGILISHKNDLTGTIDSTNEMIDVLTEICDLSTEIIDQTTTILDSTSNVQATLNAYEPEIQSALTDTKATLNALSDLMTASSNTGNTLHNSIKNTRDGLYDGTDATIDGAVQTFNDAIDSLGETDALKAHKDTIKNTIDDEWDKLDDDYNLLDIDPDALPQSFVSAQNTDLNSVQVVLRTPEITLDEVKKAEPVEQENAALGIWEKIKNIFKQMLGK